LACDGWCLRRQDHRSGRGTYRVDRVREIHRLRRRRIRWVTGSSGMAAVTELVNRLGMIKMLDAAIGPIKSRDRGYTGGQLLVGLAAAHGTDRSIVRRLSPPAGTETRRSPISARTLGQGDGASAQPARLDDPSMQQSPRPPRTTSRRQSVAERALGSLSGQGEAGDPGAGLTCVAWMRCGGLRLVHHDRSGCPVGEGEGHGGADAG
jgi:hypothetical protein